MKRIAVLLHERDRRAERMHFILWAVCDVWRSRGVAIEILRGVEREPEADLLIPHLDLTLVPDEYRAFLARAPNVLNRTALDSSKAGVSANLVRPGDGWQGPVIVKTDRNCGGLPERRLFERTPPRGRAALAVGRLLHRLGAGRARPLGRARSLDPRRYPVFPRACDVPPAVFENPALVVERFLPETDRELYCLRSYTFMGERHIGSLRRARDPVVKAASAGPREDAEVPEPIVAARRRLGLDYGKLDFVIHGGEPVLLDVNRTPTFAGHALTPAQRRLAEWLADGIAC